MKAHIKIGLKNSITGLFASAAAAATVIFAIHRYAGPVPPVLYPCAAAIAVFVTMNRALWRGISQAYDAGEVGRRMAQINVEHREGRGVSEPSNWFARDDLPASNDNGSGRNNKKALPALAPEGLV